MEKNSPKLWATVTIVVSLVGCVGTVLGAFVGAPWVEKLIFPTALSDPMLMPTISVSEPPVQIVTQPVATPIDNVWSLPTATLRPSPTPFYEVNLIYNGDFANGIDGWEREVKDEGGSGAIQEVEFRSTHNNKAIHLAQTGKGAVAIYQSVPVESVENLRFVATFLMENQGMDMLITGGGGCLLGLVYEHVDASGEAETLGETYWINYGISMLNSIGPMGAEIQSTNTIHYLEAKNGEVYVREGIAIDTEIRENLLAVESDRVNRIGIVAYCINSTNEKATSNLTMGDLLLAKGQ